MKLILSAILILAISWTCEGRPSDTKVACNEAADILFIVDTSSSIWPGFYNNIRTFLKDVISSFNIGPGPRDSRVGVVTFSSREYLEFHLNKYQTVGDLQMAVDKIRFRGGDTYTHRALEFASKVMLSPLHGSREGVSKLVVVLTDGKSVNDKKTAEAATILKSNGTDVFAVGVGDGVDFKELDVIASSPSEQYVYKVTDYKALDSIKSAFAQTTCEVLTSTTAPPTTETTSTTTTTTTTPTTITTTAAPTTTTTVASSTTRITTRKSVPKTTTEELPLKDAEFDKKCEGKTADIYLLLDASSSVWIGHFHDQVLPFVRKLVSSFEISPLYTRIGLVTFSDNVNHEFDLEEHQNLTTLLAAIQPEHVDYLTGGTNTGDAIEFIRKKGFGAGESRHGVTKSIVVITDGLSQLPTKTAEAAATARDEGILIFAVGVGLETDLKELSDIASDPDQDFVFNVDNFTTLTSITQLLAQKTCKALSDEDSGKPSHLAQCSKLSANVMFVYDYVNSVPASKVIVQELISQFARNVAVSAARIKVGIVTQPCVGGVTSLQSIGEFQESVANIRASYSIEYPELVRQLRTETFYKVPMTEQRVAVMVVDETTQHLELLVQEVKRLKFTNVKVIVVAVGKVEEVVLEELASVPIKDYVLRVDSYSHMRESKLDILGVLCGNNQDIFGEYETVNQYETVTPTIGGNNQHVPTFDYIPN